MGSIFRARPSDKKWTISWVDQHGKRRQRAAYRDRRASMKLLAEVETDVEARRSGRFDQFEEHRRRSIAAHLADFQTMLVSRGVTKRHIDQSMARLRKAIGAMRADNIEQLSYSGATTFLAALRTNEQLAAKTIDDHASLLKSFGQWLLDDERAAENPFRRLRNHRTEADQTRRRQALTFPQLGALAAAAAQRDVQETAAKLAARKHKLSPERAEECIERARRTGERRALLYWFAGLTGLRANECRQVVWADLSLGAESPTVTVRAQYAKSRKSAQVPLHRHLVRLLEEERRRQALELRRPVAADDPVLQIGATTSHRWVLDRLRKDAAWAELKITDDEGRVLDFHALRASCATILAAHGASPAVAQRILRHSDPRITMKVYTKLGIGELAGAMDAIPDPDAVQVNPQAEIAPGSAGIRRDPPQESDNERSQSHAS